MKLLRIFGLSLFATLALGIVAVASASAESNNIPLILVLPGENITQLSYSAKPDVNSTFETAGKKSISCTGGEAKSETYEESEKKATDANLGRLVVTFTGCKQEKVACRSETSKGEKDPIETILAVTDFHIADETSTTKVLEPTITLTLLPAAGAGNPIWVCGTIKDEVQGRETCLLLPGLVEIAAGGTVETLCKEASGKQETGTCDEPKAFCEEVAKQPFEANFNGKFEAAAMVVHELGSWNKMVFIDD